MVYWPYIYKQINTKIQRAWYMWPEMCIMTPVALAGFAFFTYFGVIRHKSWTDASYYKEHYTVYRPDDPHVKWMHLPGEYPPYWMSVRENFDYKSVKKDYETVPQKK